VTSLAVLEVTEDGLRLLERAPGVSVDEIREATEPELLTDGVVPEVAI
jgi:3-oxoacid CoA-transferase subunit B